MAFITEIEVNKDEKRVEMHIKMLSFQVQWVLENVH